MRLLGHHFRELYRHRLLIESLVRREVTARYRGSILGYFWTLLNPLMLLFVYHLIFTRYTKAVDLPNYFVFVFVGILPWLWLSTSITTGSTSISQGGALLSRVCIPPQVLPAVAVLSNLVNLLLGLPVALLAAAAVGILPSPAFALLPVVIAVELAFLYPVVLVLATITVRFRDVAFLVQNLLTIWFFLTPIAYPLAMVPGGYRAIVVANPATALLVPFQQICYEGAFPAPLFLAIGAAWAALSLPVAVWIFESMRDDMVEDI